MLQVHADLAVAVVSAAHDFPSDLLSTEGRWEALQRMDGLKSEAEAGPDKVRIRRRSETRDFWYEAYVV